MAFNPPNASVLDFDFNADLGFDLQLSQLTGRRQINVDCPHKTSIGGNELIRRQ
jgi:hypothetical protein